MICIVSMCSQKLHEYEFVKPLVNILKECKPKVISYKEKIPWKEFNAIVFSGTSLKDFDYLKYVENFSWLKDCTIPVFGICAGSHIIANIFGGELIEDVKIGPYEIETVTSDLKLPKKFRAYFLHALGISQIRDFKVLATSKTPSLLKHEKRPIYACLFHPEVLNPEILIKFISNSNYQKRVE